MTQPNGVHHLAVMTKDIKVQIEFFTQVLGLPLVALYDMHGVDGAWHGFVRLNDTSYVAFCQIPGVESVPSTIGLTHAGLGSGISAPGTMQHIAFDVASEDDLLAMRDRLRTNGVVVFGPIDHGFCKSLYFAGPEQLTLEVAYSAQPISADSWIDPSVVALAGISSEELDRFCSPALFDRPSEPVSQPAIDPSRPHMPYPPEIYEVMVSVPDDVITASASYPEPPVKANAATLETHS
jgi:catechol 2,3-dioxygenase-like lactoylglutathione lyase family enzyme